jgi:hypothetical protein
MPEVPDRKADMVKHGSIGANRWRFPAFCHSCFPLPTHFADRELVDLVNEDRHPDRYRVDHVLGEDTIFPNSLQAKNGPTGNAFCNRECLL